MDAAFHGIHAYIGSHKEEEVKETIDINRPRLIAALTQLRARGYSEVLTTKILDEYMGGFHSNRGVPAAVSWNAQFGKYLRDNAASLRITYISNGIRVVVNGHPTTSALWGIHSHGELSAPINAASEPH